MEGRAGRAKNILGEAEKIVGGCSPQASLLSRLYLLLIFGSSKAFGTVDHNILLRKLFDQFGIKGLANKFFESYLSNRFQYVN